MFRGNSRTYVGYVPKLPDDFAVAIDDLLLKLESYLAAHLGGIRETALIYHGQDLPELRIGIRSRQYAVNLVREGVSMASGARWAVLRGGRRRFSYRQTLIRI